MSILDKLGLKCPVDEIRNEDDAKILYMFLKLISPDTEKELINNASELLEIRKEWESMLEALIDQVFYQLQWVQDLRDECSCDFCELAREKIELIESLTNLKWSEIIKKIKE